MHCEPPSAFRPSARALAALLLLLLERGVEAQQVPVFGTTAEAVYVDVLVRDHGRNVPGLKASDFELLDNGAPQSVEVLDRAKVPLQAVLVFDVSRSVAGPRLQHLKAAATAFLDGLSDADRVAVVAFNHQIWIAAGPAVPRSEARRAVGSLEAWGGTALYDAVHVGLTVADSAVGRPVVLDFSDGQNMLSWTTRERAIETSRRADAVVYGVGAGGLESTARDFLRALADVTGGRVWQTQDDTELRAAFAQLLLEIGQRYLLRYDASTAAAPGWHALKVRVRGRRAEVRTRAGYVRP